MVAKCLWCILQGLEHQCRSAHLILLINIDGILIRVTGLSVSSVKILNWDQITHT